jgi:phosphatidylserine/phosphatidylglycerophosphate/cardiolipin synthase-like enzyme
MGDSVTGGGGRGIKVQKLTRLISITITSLVAIFLLTACIESPPTATSPQPTVTASGETSTPPLDWIAIYFSDTHSPTADSYRGGPDAALADAIHKAHASVDVAIYHLNLWSIRDALIEAHQKGVQVRVVTESDNLDEVEIQELIDAGIPVLGDRRESYMHNKFVVIDNAEVWTGSMNFTTTGAYHNDNHLIRLRSPQLAENYTTEFEEMFTQDFFGDNILSNTPHPQLEIEGALVETYFSPDDGTAGRIVELINAAQSTISFMVYSFTSDEIASALLSQASNGVTVMGVFEENQYLSNAGTKFDQLLASGLDVRLDGNPNNMHHKVLIIDEAIVITGSYNFSNNAEKRNDENTLVIHHPAIAAEYLAEFERVFGEAQRNE